MSWKPITDKHAIERVRFILGFQEELTQKTFDELGASFKGNASQNYALNDFEEETRDDIQMSMSSNLVQNFRKIPNNTVFKFQKTIDSGETVDSKNITVLEDLTITRHNVSFEVLSYNNWNIFYETAQKLIEQITDITVKTVDIHQLSLEYWYKFVFEGVPSKANPALLLKDLDPQLPEKVFTDGEMWHLTKGWLQPSGNQKEKILVKLSYTAHDATHVKTKASHRLLEVNTLTAFKTIYSENSVSRLVKDTKKLHKVSKDLLLNSLVDDMKKSVKL